MKKPDGSYRTYDQMVAENIPLRYAGIWSDSHICTFCDENGQGKPFSTYQYGLFMSEVAVDVKTGAR